MLPAVIRATAGSRVICIFLLGSAGFQPSQYATTIDFCRALLRQCAADMKYPAHNDAARRRELSPEGGDPREFLILRACRVKLAVSFRKQKVDALSNRHKITVSSADQ